MRPSILLKLVTFLVSLFLARLAVAQSVSLNKNVFAPGEKIIVNFIGFPGSTTDWISISKPGTADGIYHVWQYTAGARNGSLTFDGLAYGDYEIRGHYNNESIVRARTSFKVGNADGNLVARTIQQTYTQYEKINVTFSGLPGNNNDWISISKPGSADGAYVAWLYTAGKQNGTLEFPGVAAGDYELRTHFNNESTVRSRHSFQVTTTATVKGASQRLCRKELSVFFAGMGGLGSAWGRAATEPFNMNPGAVSDMQGVLGNARDALNMIKCIPFDINKLNALISRLPALNNRQAVDEIEALIKELEIIISRVTTGCGNSATLLSLYVSAVHIGAAQAWASSRICQVAPMPANIQSVIRNHLGTAQNAFAAFIPCVPGVSLNQFMAIPLGSINSAEPHTHIVGLHTNLLWNISLSECCCNCG